MASTNNGDFAAQQAQEGRQARRALASGNTATGKPWNPGTIRILEHRVAREMTPAEQEATEDHAGHDIDEPYLKVNTPNEYPQSSWGHIGRRPYGGAK